MEDWGICDEACPKHKAEKWCPDGDTRQVYNGFLTGTDVMIFKIFSPKNSAKKLAFLTKKNKGKLCKIWSITLFFCEKRHFIAENWRKSQKIVIITSTPGFKPMGNIGA
jgi:hypothetical protein